MAIFLLPAVIGLLSLQGLRAEAAGIRAEESGVYALSGEGGDVAYVSHLSPGWVPQGRFGNGFKNVDKAEIHLVLHAHGAASPELSSGTVRAFRAGCQDEAVINPEFPASVRQPGNADSERCQDLQFAVFLP